MTDRERIALDSRRRRPQARVDVIVLVVLVGVVLRFGRGHGPWGWALALAAVVFAGLVVGILGRRYPWIHGQRRRARRVRSD